MATLKEKDWEKIRHFIEGQMSDSEIRDFNRELSEDPDLLDALRFEFALREGQHRERREKYRQGLKKPFFPMWLAGLAAALLLGMGLWWLLLRPVHPFTRQEGHALLAEIIEESRRKEILGPMASGVEEGRWRQLLLQGRADPEKWDEALRYFEQEIAKEGPCIRTLYEAYTGLILSLHKRQYAEAQSHLDCSYDTEPRLREDLELPIVLNQAGLGNYDEARRLLEQYGISYSSLPDKARELLDRE